MNREQAKKLLPFIQALADGKSIQSLEVVGVSDHEQWADIRLIYGHENPERLRIKPEPKLRRWKPEECPLYFMVRHKMSAELSVACKQHGYDHARVFRGSLNGSAFSMGELFDLYMQVDSNGRETPCGVLEEA